MGQILTFLEIPHNIWENHRNMWEDIGKYPTNMQLSIWENRQAWVIFRYVK
jgi:hypothetical protein